MLKRERMGAQNGGWIWDDLSHFRRVGSLMDDDNRLESWVVTDIPYSTQRLARLSTKSCKKRLRTELDD